MKRIIFLILMASFPVFAQGTSTGGGQQNGGGSGTVTSVSGTTNQVDVATGTTTPVISLDSAIVLPGTIELAQTGIFTSGTMREYMQSLLNSCNPSTEY